MAGIAAAATRLRSLPRRECEVTESSNTRWSMKLPSAAQGANRRSTDVPPMDGSSSSQERKRGRWR